MVDELTLKKEIRGAIKEGNVDRVAELIDSDQRVLEMDTPFGRWLHVAASSGQLEVVKLLVTLGADVNIRAGILGAGPLRYASSEGFLDIVKYLVSAGADLDISEPERNPLFGAIYGGHPEVARFLLDQGIDATIRYSGQHMDQMGALEFAIERGHTDIAEMLEKHNRRNDANGGST